ncbi:PEP-CTERM sorting domain-containing protein [Aquabacterium sp. A7-Y]|uniref:PEP-CTERM sorting domain-containing protein n=1 Tax=Aquabacterium sp. A7-Y TaxID=1349605 RepID=UPI00223DCC4F|nr:PEP-CTERM sorting domain-containing protein [Aquabacterium sp. A7-Y]MCW7537799.1 PEP-CTERM sorting domain-containing protein [Aquabacterium sp. A7-Y]
MKNVIAGLALALTLPIAMADSATARLSNLAITVEDLDPSDPNVPNPSWSQNVGRSEVTYILPGAQPIVFGRDLTGPTDTLSYEQGVDNLTVNADWNEGLLEATADVSGTGVAYSGFTSRDIQAPGLLFLIPAQTSVTLSADAFVTAATDYLCATTCFGARAFAGLTLTVNGEEQADQAEVAVGNGATFDTLSGQLTLTYSNTTEAAQWASLSAFVDVTGEVVPVPEPETYALMGLGLAALMLRRRSTAASKAQASA